jgi:hypothetical protein
VAEDEHHHVCVHDGRLNYEVVQREGGEMQDAGGTRP